MFFYSRAHKLLLCLAVCLLLGRLCQADALAETPATMTGEDSSAGTNGESELAPDDAAALSPNVADTAHRMIEQDLLARVIAFDDLFGSNRTDMKRQTKYQLRWRNSFRADQVGKIKFGTTAGLNVTLSKISDRLRLVITGEDELEQRSPSLPADPGTPGFDRTTSQDNRPRLVNTELRYGLLRSSSIESFVGVGVRVVWPPEAFGRWRFQFTQQLNETMLSRIGETFFIKNAVGLGATTDFTLQQIIDPQTMVRWATTATASQEFEGLEWGSELSLNHQLSPISAVALTGGVYGNTITAAAIESYRLFARYRRQFLREWLYFELEPEVSWPRNGAGRYPAFFAGTFRLEVVFAGSAAVAKQ